MKDIKHIIEMFYILKMQKEFYVKKQGQYLPYLLLIFSPIQLAAVAIFNKRISQKSENPSSLDNLDRYLQLLLGNNQIFNSLVSYISLIVNAIIIIFLIFKFLTFVFRYIQKDKTSLSNSEKGYVNSIYKIVELVAQSIIAIYLYFLQIPIIYFSLSQKNIDILGYVNTFLAILIGNIDSTFIIILTYQQNKLQNIGLMLIDSDYNYTSIAQQDILARPYHIIQIIQQLILFTCLWLSCVIQKFSFYFIISYQLIDLLIFYFYRQFNQATGNKFYFFCQLSCLFITMNYMFRNDQIDIISSSFVAILAQFCFAYKFVQILYQKKQSNLIESYFSLINDNNLEWQQLDQIVRANLLNTKDLNTIQQRQILIISLISNLNFNQVNENPEIEEQNLFKSDEWLLDQLNQQILKKFLKQQKNQSVDFFITYFIFLIQKNRNYILYLIENQRLEKLHHLSIKQRQILSQINKLFIKEKTILERTQGTSSPFSKYLLDQISFSNKVVTLREKMTQAITQKLNLLDYLHEKEIDSLILLKLLKPLQNNIFVIRQSFKELYLQNRQSKELIEMQNVYQEYLSFSSNDIPATKPSEINQKDSHKSNQQNSCIIFANSEKNNIWTIKKATSGIQQMFELPEYELQNKEITTLMPQVFRNNHFQYINDFMNKDIFKTNIDSHSSLLLFAQNAQGFIFPVTLEVRVNYQIKEEQCIFGLVSQLSQLYLNQEFILFSKPSLYIHGISKNLSKSLFKKVKMVQSLKVSQIFPFMKNHEICNFQKETDKIQILDEAKSIKEESTINDYNFQYDFNDLEKLNSKDTEFLAILRKKKNKRFQLTKQKIKEDSTQNQILSKDFYFFLVNFQIKNLNHKYHLDLSIIQINSINQLSIFKDAFQIIPYIAQNLQFYQDLFGSFCIREIISELTYICGFQDIDQYSFDSKISYAVLPFEQDNFYQLAQSQNSHEENTKYSLEHKISIESSMKFDNLIKNKDASLRQNSFQNVRNSDLDAVNYNSKFLKQESFGKNCSNVENEHINKLLIPSDRSIKIDMNQYQNYSHELRGLMYSPKSNNFHSTLVDMQEEDNLMITSGGREKQKSHMNHEFTTIQKPSNFKIQSSTNKQIEEINERLEQEDILNSSKQIISNSKENQICESNINIKSMPQTTSNKLLSYGQFNQNNIGYNKKLLKRKFNFTIKQQTKLNLQSKKKNVSIDKNNFKMNFMEVQSTNSKSSASSSQINVLKSLLTKNRFPSVIKIINYIGISCFLIIILLLILQYVLSVEKININKTDQDNFPFLVDYQNFVFDIIKYMNIIHIYDRDTPSNVFQVTQERRQKIIDEAKTVRLAYFQEIYQMLSDMTGADSQLDLFEILRSNQVDYTIEYLYPLDKLKEVSSIQTTIQDFKLKISIQNAILYSQSNAFRYIHQLPAPFIEYYHIVNSFEISKRLQGFYQEINDSGVSQTNSVKNYLTTIISIVLAIMSLCIFIINPLYAFIQNKRDEALFLFGTFSTNQLSQMSSKLHHYLSQIQTSNKQIKSNFDISKSLISSNENLKINYSKFYQQNQSNRISISTVSKLPKCNIKINIILFIIFIVVTIIPIVALLNTLHFFEVQIATINTVCNFQKNFQLNYCFNYQFTKAQLLFIKILDLLHKFQFQATQLMSISYFCLALKLYPNEFNIDRNLFLDYLQQAVKGSKEGLSDLSILSNESEIRQYYDEKKYDEFIDPLLKINTFQQINDFLQYQTDLEEGVLEQCSEIQHTNLSRGLYLDYNQFLSEFNILVTYLTNQDQITDDQLLKQASKDFDIYQITHSQRCLISSTQMFHTFIKIQYKDKYELILLQQIVFLVSQIALLSLLMIFGWIKLSYFFSEQIINTQKYLQIINISLLIENNYIISFVRKNRKL